MATNPMVSSTLHLFPPIRVFVCHFKTNLMVNDIVTVKNSPYNALYLIWECLVTECHSYIRYISSSDVISCHALFCISWSQPMRFYLKHKFQVHRIMGALRSSGFGWPSVFAIHLLCQIIRNLNLQNHRVSYMVDVM